jgi:glycerol kinase
MPHIVSFDQGTTSSRTLVVDELGQVVATAQREFTQHYPKPGRVEHDATEIWTTQLATAREALAKARLEASDIAAIGLTNQRETTLLWQRATGKPIAPAIVWQDRRTAPLCEALRDAGHEPMIREMTGLLLDPYFSATKIRWLLDEIPGARAAAERGELAFGTIDTWLVWNLTRGAAHLTDPSNASRTLLYNLHTGTWDDSLLDLFDIPRTLLPEIVPSAGPLATADASWFGRALPVTGIAGDQQAALFGQACHQPGMIKNTYGTGCFLLLNTGPSPVTSAHKLLTTAAWRLGNSPPVFALEGSVFSGGSVVQWLRDGLGLIERAADIESLAASVPDSGDVVLVPAFTGLGAPVWDASARGLIIGLTRGTTRAHLARAALESIAFQVADVVESMARDTGTPPIELRVDGGAAANNVLLQFQADLLGLPVVRPVTTESTALGAAFLAGLGAGVWHTPNELTALWKAERRFEPALDPTHRAERLARWRTARDRACGWA